jgi:hypothetical protein
MNRLMKGRTLMKKNSKSNRAQFHGALLMLILATMLVPFLARGDGSDNFDDDKRDATLWGTTVVSGRGALSEANGRLQYGILSPTAEDECVWQWKKTRFPYNADWSVQIDLVNDTKFSADEQVNSFGLKLLGKTADHSIYSELYASTLGGSPARFGFSSGFKAGGPTLTNADTSGDITIIKAAVRIGFSTATKVVTIYYETNINDGYQWVPYGAFGVAGTGADSFNADWGMTEADQFTIYVYGYSENMQVHANELFGDNFSETGGVADGGSVIPVPVGVFRFYSPTNNPLIARILSLTGNYRGTLGQKPTRNYAVDVAQDESGKVMTVGTLDGLKDKRGETNLTMSVGAVKTVAGEPILQTKQNFNGTVDDRPFQVAGTATAPLKLVDLGDGTNGVAATITAKGKLDGVPFSARNQPMEIVPTADMTNNAKQDWSLDLVINKKLVGRKEQAVASARLLLPNGATIQFPEKVARYNTKKGYTLSFARGTNVTVVPNAISKTSTILIKGMTMTGSGTNWTPTAGTITYGFLGQKGTANLLDFLAP